MVVHKAGGLAAGVRSSPPRRFMNLVKLSCAFCGKKFFRPTGRVNEAKKFGWKQFCSAKCLANSKITGLKLSCSNPECNKRFFRQLREIKKVKRSFCSQSCAAVVNNLPRRKIKTCPICGKQFCGERKYCSNFCRSRVINPKKKSESEKRQGILNRIKTFYKTQGRIPIKKEKPGLARGAQAVFGTWNKAIEAAGFEPNPVRFAKKYISNDGHKCDSFAEKIIDDWLYSKNIQHQRGVPYPYSAYTADFQVDGKFIEFFGLSGELEEYDKNTKLKEELSERYNLKLIKIYPKDLFPVNKLAKILKV